MLVRGPANATTNYTRSDGTTYTISWDENGEARVGDEEVLNWLASDAGRQHAQDLKADKEISFDGDEFAIEDPPKARTTTKKESD